MTRTLLSAGPSLALLAIAMPAQQIWVVDPNGTGNFTDLQVAIQTVASGDTLLLRGGGHYTGTYSFQKHLSFVGVPPGRALVNRFQMSAAPGTSLSVVSLDVTRITTEVPTSLEDVHLEQCNVNASHTFLNRCTMGQPNPTHRDEVLLVVGASALVTSSTLYGSSAWVENSRFCGVRVGQAPVQVFDGTVSIADSTLIGTPPQSLFCPSGPATSPGSLAMQIHGTGSTAWIAQSTVTSGSSTLPTIWAGVGTTVYHDTQTQFTPAFTGTPTFLPTTRGDGAQPGSTITCHAQTEPGYPAVLAASLGKHPASMLPTIGGNAWIAPNAFVVLVIGFADGTGQLPATIPVPATAPRGLPITVQAAVAPPGSGLTAATPVVVHVR
ncbi:MAG: hypothetical protein NXI31_11245 [bacterium]|nr:hypothetical protein [bacterium]